VAQVRRLGPKVGSRLALFCIHRKNRVNSRNDSETLSHGVSTLNIVLVLLVLYYIITVIATSGDLCVPRLATDIWLVSIRCGQPSALEPVAGYYTIHRRHQHVELFQTITEDAPVSILDVKTLRLK